MYLSFLVLSIFYVIIITVIFHLWLCAAKPGDHNSEIWSSNHALELNCFKLCDGTFFHKYIVKRHFSFSSLLLL